MKVIYKMSRFVVLFLSLPLVAFAIVIWPDLVNDEAKLSRPKPTSWSEKNLGQWCRNFTVNQHTQCPEASLFHQFDCCGVNNTNCCFAIQGWVFVVVSFASIAAIVSFSFYLLLKFQMICIEHTYPPKVIHLDRKH
ncbi:hypothetical protein KIN20_034679 [Parelaphostrongylus tenuis]|uniref:Uncharacterized protein n=1 Tax=Parelaphostrongylus tenuis TaxID=148309 RepID=A0AAD5RA10_PARTN|nr:hypothetical protein KIN20_034679 [Parelaphostrongylus tenuis]